MSSLSQYIAMFDYYLRYKVNSQFRKAWSRLENFGAYRMDHRKRGDEGIGWAISNADQNPDAQLAHQGSCHLCPTRMAENQSPTHRIMEVKSTPPKLQFQDQEGTATPPMSCDPHAASATHRWLPGRAGAACRPPPCPPPDVS